MMRGLALVLLLTAGPAMAQDAPAGYDGSLIPTCLDRVAAGGDPAACIGAAADPCMAQPGGQTTLGMVQCLTAETHDWDSLLNRWYGKAMDRAKSRDRDSGGDEPTAPVLKQAQRNWIAYRDESCRYEALRYQGGSIAGVVRARCLQELTARQALRLRALAEQEG